MFKIFCWQVTAKPIVGEVHDTQFLEWKLSFWNAYFTTEFIGPQDKNLQLRKRFQPIWECVLNFVVSKINL
ncbi:hypothetical protein T231_03190 [Tannerella sp. oral taxon BU063 isolate Cell 6/7/9]|uniref:Uncharacterized protein n=1 Tax=Tannerella sp. oral taxon BU063 isolate Cell 6/7/9 TaxID=1411021 RepID=W2CUM1_9BACT|nr:hypothetical protein T231_03190 [Tannerella sp. oral taxon BU063 isolate Cell 6/7/9]